MYETIRALLGETEFSVVESLEIPGRAARHEQIPRFLFESRLGAYLAERLGESGMWMHQARALEALGRGENVVVSTGTASGKSLVFQTLALHRILQDSSARVIVFYPLRALVEDQFRSWQEMASQLGLDTSTVGRIDGTVRVADREAILQEARVLVMTPDVCQAWLMSRLAMPAVRAFLTQLSMVVMDEAHTLEGVFGSSFAFLIRRLMAARNHLRGSGEASPLQLVGATATIANPEEHMKLLTGADFLVIGQESDGAPQHDRVIAHIASPEGDELSVARALQRRVLADRTDGGFITFVDSRKGVETLAIFTERDIAELTDEQAIASYRAGLDPDERRRIESQLRNGILRGVVSTSALEMGIDFPTLRVGFNLGVPQTRKAYRQRLGRVGRNGPGAFVVIGPPDAFRRFGTSLREYHDMSVEPSYLYLDNRFMQFAHGRCLADEREATSAPADLPARIGWPAGFGDRYKAARPAGDRAPEFDAIAALGGDTPHLGYPLRNVGEVSFEIKLSENASSIGDVSQSQALRECYPGATYLHGMRAYEVAAWNVSTFSPFIRVKRGAPRRSTRPHIVTYVRCAITANELTDGHLQLGNDGFLAECQMLITERVDGYTDNQTGQFHSYQELQKKNPNMRARSRNFRTTGVVLRVGKDWFRPDRVKREFADRIRDVFAREYSVLAHDVGSSATNITVQDSDGKAWRGGCIVLFDQTYGSLRLTERLYTDFGHILDRLAAADGDSDTFKSVVQNVQEEYSQFSPADPLAIDFGGAPPSGSEQVFTPGSRVCFQQKGSIARDVEIIQPTIWPNGELMYQVEASVRPGQPPMRNWVPASAIEPSADADAWAYAWWNRQTETYEDPPEDDR